MRSDNRYENWIDKYRNICSLIVIALYFTLRYFNVHGTSIKYFISNRLPLLVFIPTYFWHLSQFPLPLSQRFDHLLDLPLVYIKFLLTINKQFGMDSFLDWEDYYRVSCSSQPDHSNVLVIRSWEFNIWNVSKPKWMNEYQQTFFLFCDKTDFCIEAWNTAMVTDIYHGMVTLHMNNQQNHHFQRPFVSQI